MKNILHSVVAAAALVAGFYGCVSREGEVSQGDAPSVDDSAKAVIRVGTYNIRLSGGDVGTPNAWELRKDDLVALLKKQNLDVFGMQEVCPDQAQYLREKLPGYEFVGEHRNADRVSGEASPVVYRKDRFYAEKSGTFWLSETPDVPGVKGWGAACPRVCSYLVLRDRRSGRRFCFANTHTDHVSAEAREKGMLLVIERMKDFGEGCPIVFTGDHNCRETAAPAKAVSKILSNAMLVSETPPKGPWRTFTGWRWREREHPAVEALKFPPDVRNSGGSKNAGDAAAERPPVYFGPRIDYIYVSQGVKVLDYATVADARPGQKLYPSDHFPVVATVVIPASSPLAADSVSLDGEWNLKYWQQKSAEEAVREIAAVPANAKAVKASVPGNCELDLVNAGIMPQPEVGMNVREFRKCEGYGWLYAKEFRLPPGFVKESRVRLVFDGIDTFADIFLNGVKVGEAENMLVPHSFDVTKALKPGKNLVQVLIRSSFLESQKYDVGELGYHMGFADGEPIRKAGFMGGWDIFPRLYCAGLWRGVRLEAVPCVAVDNVAWMFGDFDAKFTRCTAKVNFRVKGPADAFDWSSKVRLTLSRGGKVAYSAEREYVAVQNEMKLHLDRPALWWPKGMGESALYEAKIEIVGKDGEVLASDVRNVGVRLVKLERDDVYGPDRPGQFLFRVNGEPCYVRGSNWVPLDSFPSRQAGRIAETLEMFEDLNCNMVRVWGGGVYEPEEFFDWCDAHGLMVWQDFMTGCSVFPQDDRYAALTADEVKNVVIALRNHPSLVLWSGNNENDDAGGFGWGSQREFKQDCGRDRNSRRTIPDILFEYDVTRPYLPSSPYKSPDVVAGLAKPSEMHLWGAREYYKTPYYTNSPCWFASEMGYHGCANRDSLEKMMTKDCVYPWKGSPEKFERDHRKLDWNDEWRLKSSDPFMKAHEYLWRRNDLMTNQIRIMFGGVDTDLDTFIEQSQFVQAEAMKTFCELFRTRKFTRFNGLVWWNVRDGWPQLSDAVVDYYGGKKRAYYALKNAQQDQIVCLVDDHTAWAVNDALRPVKGSAKFTDAATGKVLFDAGEFEIPSNGKLALGQVPFSGQGVVRIDAKLDGRQYTNHFLYGEPPFDWSKVRGLLPR